MHMKQITAFHCLIIIPVSKYYCLYDEILPRQPHMHDQPLYNSKHIHNLA